MTRLNILAICSDRNGDHPSLTPSRFAHAKRRGNSGREYNLAMAMTLLQIAIRVLNISQRIDAGNWDLQFSLVDHLGEISQYRRSTSHVSASLSLDAILGYRLKVDNCIDTFWSDTKPECKFDVISTECINKCGDVIVRSRTNTLLNASTVGEWDYIVVLQPMM